MRCEPSGIDRTQGPLTPGSVNLGRSPGHCRSQEGLHDENQRVAAVRWRPGACRSTRVAFGGQPMAVLPRRGTRQPPKGRQCQPGPAWSRWSYMAATNQVTPGPGGPSRRVNSEERRLSRSSGALPFGFRRAGAFWRPTLGVARRHADQVCVVGAPRSVSPRGDLIGETGIPGSGTHEPAPKGKPSLSPSSDEPTTCP